ncbi:MAG: chorismate synthase [Clostridia bacterium]|nr:chorismate synthase [Clostridia bacterium]
MSVFNGKKLKIEIYGESHAEKIGVRVSGMPEFCFDEDKLLKFLERRKASGAVYSTARAEDDIPVLYGAAGGRINGDFTAEIFNKNVRSGDYNDLYGRPRPSHADYAWHKKDGALDYFGGGRFSGRLTAPFCVIGGICKQYLESRGVKIDAYISKIGKVKGVSYKDKGFSTDMLSRLEGATFPSLSNAENMLLRIDSAKKNLDSVGGVIECIVRGYPAGIGNDLFEGLEGKIALLCYSVPAVKGVEFGGGFSMSETTGKKANDELYFENGEVKFSSNNSGGVNGGISNGNYLSLAVAIKPTASIARAQKTVDLISGKTVKIKIKGRHDSCIAPRAVPVIESAVAIALTDELI